ISFLASAGNVNGTGTTAATLTLDAAGHATVTYACDFTLDPTHCGAGSVVVTASWSTVANGTRVTLQGPSSTGTDAGPTSGGTDAGPIVVGPAGGAGSVTATASAPGGPGLQRSRIPEEGGPRLSIITAHHRYS